MGQQEICYDTELTIDGMGMVIYSIGAVEHINEGENFFSKEFSKPEQVAEHIRKGDIVGFNLGTSGTFNIKFRSGYPSLLIEQQYPISIRLALNVIGGTISIIDLFWLMEWSNDCPQSQQINLEDGYYHMTVSTARPKSGIWGDSQDIYIFLEKIDVMPKLAWSAIPQLYIE